IVNIFVHWLYIQKVPESRDFEIWDRIMETEEEINEDIKTKSSKDTIQHLYMLGLKVYVLADRFLALQLREKVSRFLTTVANFPTLDEPRGSEISRYAFNNIPSDRPILQHLVDHFCRKDFENRGEGKDAIDAQNQLPREFLMRVTRSFAKLRDLTAAKMSKRCYLEHASEEEKDQCTKDHMRFDAARDCGYFD
ncbi:hypothetical protein CC86DRAFT_278529, partial [Ophiobolus disseminans]